MNVNSKIPKAYLDGHIDFYGRVFWVTPDVLIPRPESEQIIDMVLSLAGKPFLPGVKPPKRTLKNRPTILDIGTGSGCLAITIKKELPEADVIATDISEKALQVAKENATRQNADIAFIISHLLKKVKSTPDLIVANLPYVDKNWTWLDHEALNYEPSLALYAKDQGLSLIKELLDTASSKYLILEADPCQHQSIINYAKGKFTLVDIRGFAMLFKWSRL